MSLPLVHDPIDVTPARPPGSVRRTSHIDMIFAGDNLELRGAARDLRTAPDGTARLLAEAKVHAELDDARHLMSLEVSPPAPGAGALVGLPVAKGFRAAVAAAAPEEQEAGTPLFLLLDDLPVATLISGYALLYLGLVDTKHPDRALKEDICSGWRAEGTMMVSVRRGDGVPVPHGPVALPLDRPGDGESWHPIGPLPPGAMRRQRLVEVSGGEVPLVWAMFRDSHHAPDGRVTVIHEYVVEGRVDRARMTLLACEATPKVLPWGECPDAAASARRLVGMPLGSLREIVRRELTGTSTCTHLNDLLRSLGDLDHLLTAAR